MRNTLLTLFAIFLGSYFVHAQNISFEDPIVKDICITNWDTNGDGELSESEAAAVEYLGYDFSYNDQITSFNELIFFIGLTTINEYAFSECSNLTSITIPNNVVHIDGSAFEGCSSLPIIENIRYADTYLVEAADKSLPAYHIKSGTRFIGSHAFAECDNLECINIPKSVKEIGVNAFGGCNDLKIIVEDIEAWCNIDFQIWGGFHSYYGPISSWYIYSDENTQITDLTIPNSVTEIHPFTFYGCKNLKSVFIPNSVKEIRLCAFSHCDGLIEIEIPNSVTTIGNRAFEGCSKLTNINISDGVNTIGEYAFSECPNLTSINIPNSVAYIYNSAFKGCTNLPVIESIRYADTYLVEAADKSLSTYHIKSGTRFIGSNAFSECSNLTSINIPNSMTSIGSYAFSECSNLASINIPNSVTHISPEAFEFCQDVKFIVEDLKAWCNIDFDFWYSVGAYSESSPLQSGYLYSDENTQVADLVIPDGVTVIKDYAFYGCPLKTITIPGSVKSIGRLSLNDFRFDCTSSITDIYNHIMTPINIDDDCFNNENYDNATLHVPFGTKNAYANAEVWMNFVHIVDDIPSSTLRGDANGDFEVNITDVIVIIDYILGRNITNFIYANSDLDKDGDVNITDAIKVVDIILDRTPAQIPAFMPLDKSESQERSR